MFVRGEQQPDGWHSPHVEAEAYAGAHVSQTRRQSLVEA
jgi:hypothetical protein